MAYQCLLKNELLGAGIEDLKVRPYDVKYSRIKIGFFENFPDTYKLHSYSTKKCTLRVFECQQGKSTKALIRTFLYLQLEMRPPFYVQSSEPREGSATCDAKGVPSVLSYFKTPIIGLAPGIKPTTSCSLPITDSQAIRTVHFLIE